MAGKESVKSGVSGDSVKEQETLSLLIYITNPMLLVDNNKHLLSPHIALLAAR